MADARSGFEGLSFASVRRALAEALGRAGIEDPQREARLLIELATGLLPEEVVGKQERTLASDAAHVLADALARRLDHEPLSRIRGTRDFYGRPFKITPAVLDPRPETETLIDLVLEWVDRSGGRERPLTLIDVGTGSGCILVTLLAELRHATGLGTDVSVAAVDVARGNAAALGVGDRARFQIAHSLEGIEGPFEALVSNPPYIPTAALAKLPPAVRDFDPRSALDGGPDGLAVYRDIAAGAGALVPAGLVAVEVGAGQAAAVAQVLAERVKNRCGEPWTRLDLGGHHRTVALLTHP